MRFVYYPNPLRTRVYLDDKEKEIFKLKHRLEQQKWIIFGVRYRLRENPNDVLECANKHFNGKTYWELAKAEIPKNYDTEEYNAELDEEAQSYIDELENGYHMGDCTCIPASCVKCYAEEVAGIDTITGLGKHEASKIDSLFFAGKRMSTFDIRTIDEVLEILKNYKVEPFEENKEWNRFPDRKELYEHHMPRWEQEAKHTYEWLLNYKQEHGF